MNRQCFHPPPTLQLDGSFEHMVRTTYEVYERDFVFRRLLREGLPVYRDSRILADGDRKEEGYWHLVQREDKPTGIRVPDYCRASRICWTRPIIECAPCEQILAFDYDSGAVGQGGIKTYLWLRDFDFLVILKRQPRKFFLASSFCVTEDWLRDDLEVKYAKRIV